MTKILIAKAAVSHTNPSFDTLFSYRVPKSLENVDLKGKRVIVPFGRSNFKRCAMIFETVAEDVDLFSKYKPLLAVIDEKRVLSDDLLDLCRWLTENTFCTYYEACQTVLPSGLHVSIEEKYELGDEKDRSLLTLEEENLYTFLENSSTSQEFDSIIKTSLSKDKAKKKIVDSLIEKGFLRLCCDVLQKGGEKQQKMVRLSGKYLENPLAFKLTPKQKLIVDTLSEGDVSYSLNEICYVCAVSKAVIDNLLKKDIVETYEKRVMRDIIETDKTQSVDDIILSPAQQKVCDAVCSSICENSSSKCFLLHGITGSGKTSIYKKIIDKCLKDGSQAMLLVPEISLTPQIVSQFAALFGDTVAVINSSLSLGQRMDAFHRIESGKARIVIGTRSAVFAPLKNIGVIIMDEEGERSYKSENSPRYNTRDVAKYRIRRHGGVLLLASATPSIESYYLAKRGIYRLLTLKERYGNAVLPEVKIVDMAKEASLGEDMVIGDTLIKEVNKNLERGEQTILLLNRRGYSTQSYCTDCCRPVFCPNCSVPMTYHKKNHSLVCHTCGNIMPVPKRCPECGSEKMILIGFGTQKIEEQFSKLFPGARILRMDADTVFSRESYENNINDFAKGKYDILVGTQMVGKGLNFPNCTLVGVLSVDRALYSGDFRSYENTFSLCTQVVGRGGRNDKPGRAVLQTYMPEHYILRYAAAQDYEAFFRKEILLRRQSLYPPFCDLCIILLTGEIEENVVNAASYLTAYINREYRKTDSKKVPLRVFGPAKCIYGKINRKYRYRIIIKCKNNKNLRDFIRNILKNGTKNKIFYKISVIPDMNGEIN